MKGNFHYDGWICKVGGIFDPIPCIKRNGVALFNFKKYTIMKSGHYMFNGST